MLPLESVAASRGPQQRLAPERSRDRLQRVAACVECLDLVGRVLGHQHDLVAGPVPADADAKRRGKVVGPGADRVAGGRVQHLHPVVAGVIDEQPRLAADRGIGDVARVVEAAQLLGAAAAPRPQQRSVGRVGLYLVAPGVGHIDGAVRPNVQARGVELGMARSTRAGRHEVLELRRADTRVGDRGGVAGAAADRLDAQLVGTGDGGLVDQRLRFGGPADKLHLRPARSDQRQRQIRGAVRPVQGGADLSGSADRKRVVVQAAAGRDRAGERRGGREGRRREQPDCDHPEKADGPAQSW